MTYQERIDAAASLDDLCSTLNAIESELASIRDKRDSGSPNAGECIDLAGLPTFGGEEPSNTIGIWSWDRTRFLYADGPVWTVEAR